MPVRCDVATDIRPAGKPSALLSLRRCDGAKESTFSYTCAACPLRGSFWRRCGSLWRFSGISRPGFSPYLCNQATGRCLARVPSGTTPGPVFSFGRKRYRETIPSGGRQRQVTFQSVSADSCVLKDTARCPLSYSKGFRLLAETTLPLKGTASSPKSGSLFLPAACGPKTLSVS